MTNQKKIISSRALVVKDGKVLLIKRRKNGQHYYSIPGGKLEPGESLEQTVIREVAEETCISVKPLKLIATCEDKDMHKSQNLFVCEYLSGEPILGDSVEKERMEKDSTNYYEPVWVDLNEAVYLKIKPDSTATIFHDYISSLL